MSFGDRSDGEGSLSEEAKERDQASAGPPSVHVASAGESAHLEVDTVSRKQATIDIIKISGPISLAGLFSMGGAFAGAAIFSRYSKEALAAAPLINASQLLLISTSGSILNYVTVLAGRAHGAENYLEIGHILRQSMLLGVLLNIPVVTIIMFIKPILMSLGEPKAIVDVVRDFFYPVATSILPVMAIRSQSKILIGIKKVKPVMISMMANTVLATGFAYPLIYGVPQIHLPSFGPAGFGMAIAGSTWISSLGLTLYLIFKKDLRQYQLFNCQFTGHFKILSEIIRNGVPRSMQILAESLGLMGATVMVGWLGNDALSAQQVVSQYILLLTVFIMSSGQATTVMVSQARGKENFKDARRYGLTGIAVPTLFSAGVATIFSFMPTIISMPFFDVNDPSNASILDFVRTLIIVQGAGLVVDAFRNNCEGALCAFSDTKFPMFTAGLSMSIFLLLGYFLGFSEGLKIDGIFMARIAGILTASILLIERWLYRSDHAIKDGEVRPETGFYGRYFPKSQCSGTRDKVDCDIVFGGEAEPLLAHSYQQRSCWERFMIWTSQRGGSSLIRLPSVVDGQQTRFSIQQGT